jgi:hypothetical protein
LSYCYRFCQHLRQLADTNRRGVRCCSFKGDEAGCGARHVDQRPSGIGLSARRKAIAGSAAVTAASEGATRRSPGIDNSQEVGRQQDHFLGLPRFRNAYGSVGMRVFVRSDRSGEEVARASRSGSGSVFFDNGPLVLSKAFGISGMPTSVGPNPPASRTATSPPRSAASHNLLKPCPSLARWSGSRRRRRRAEPSCGIV